MGACVLLGDLGKGGVESFVEQALAGYSGTKQTAYEFRTACLYHEILKTKKLYDGCIAVLARVISPSSVSSTRILFKFNSTGHQCTKCNSS